MLDLAQRGVAADGRDLVCGAAGLGETPARRLAKAVSRAVLRKTGLVTAMAKPIAEAGSREWLAELGREKRQVFPWSRGDDLDQVRVHGDQERRAGLLLPDLN